MDNKKLQADKPIVALYDATEKKLIGIFTSISLVAKYIFEETHTTRQTGRVATSWSQKHKIYHEDMVYAIRTANDEQKQILGTLEYIILNGYKEPLNNNMKSFHTNRVYLNMEGREKSQRYLDDLKKTIWNKEIK